MKSHKTPIQIRFADIDMLKHVNNACFPTYMEIARINFFKEEIAGAQDWSKIGLILARYEIDFIKPILLSDKLFVEITVSHLGQKSFILDYNFISIEENENTLKAKGKTVMVCFDYQTENSIEIPPAWLEKLLLWKN